MKKTLANLQMQGRNVNNNNSKSMGNPTPKFSCEPEDKPDDFGEIHPQVTCEGYGLRTPYGTHFNLDFLQYCQNVAADQSDSVSPSSRRSSSSSQRNTLIACDSKSETTRIDKDLTSPDLRAGTEYSVWETRRRLDAFRSYRKKTPSIAEQHQQSSRLLKSTTINFPGIVKESVVEIGLPTASASNLPFPQQNLQSMREQMAAALTRLKDLENEVKQVEAFKVQISVLQQEKQKLNDELKVYRDGVPQPQVSLRNREETVCKTGIIGPLSRSSSPGTLSPTACPELLLAPPVPPKRRYKSVAVGPDMVLSESRNTGLLVTSKTSVMELESKDECVRNTVATSESKFTMTEQIDLHNTSTSTFDLIKFLSVCCGNHFDVRENSTQYPKLQVKDAAVEICQGDFACNASNQALVATVDKATATRRDVDVKIKVDCMDASIGNEITFSVVPVNRSMSTSMPQLAFVSQAVNTVGIDMVEKAVSCKPDNTDFGCLVNIRPSSKSFATETDVSKRNCTRITNNFALNVVEQSVNTDVVSKIDKSLSFRPDTSDFSCNVKICSGVTISTSTKKIVSAESATNTETVVHHSFAAQTNPAVVFDAGILAKILPPQADACVWTDEHILKVPLADTGTQTDLAMLQDWYENTLNLKSHCDVSTDTFELKRMPSMQNMQREIGQYVGQVESLLEEQQSLLVGRYEGLSDVLDDGNLQKTDQPQKFIELGQEIAPQLVEDPNVIMEDNRYSLPVGLKLASETAAKQQENEAGTLATAEALGTLKEEWFLISTPHESKLDLVKDFVAELRSVSPVVLSRVINSLDDTGNSALHYAVSHENFGLISTLADIPELDIDQHNNAGYTASMLAAITRIESKFEAQVMAALFQRANVSLHAKQAGQTALMLAVSHGCVPAAKLLLKAGANVNAQDEDGSTALMCAVEHGHADLVKLLLAHADCDPAITDNDGSAAINIAMDSGQRDIAVLLYVQLNLDKSRVY